MLDVPVRHLRRLGLAASLITVSLAVSACGVNETAQVRAKVQQYATAVHDHDYKTICTQVFGPRLLADIADSPVNCEQALKIGFQKTVGARLTIGTIKITGSHASVLTVSQARGQKTVLATLELSKSSGGWRIDALGNAATGT